MNGGGQDLGDPQQNLDSWLEIRPDMQQWVDAVRKHAPKNLVLVGGPHWSQITAPPLA